MREGTESTAHETDAAASEFEINELFTTLLSTTRAVLFSPQRFFDELPPDGPLGAPALHFLICSAITAVINVVASLTFLAAPVGIALATGSLDAGLFVNVLTIFVFTALVALPYCSSPASSHLCSSYTPLSASLQDGIRRVCLPSCASRATQ